MISVSDREVTIKDFYDVVFNQQAISIAPSCVDELNKSYAFLQEFSINRIIYGVNTGFGPMAHYLIPKEDRIQLQYNLIRSHASGSGLIMGELLTRAITFSRMVSLSQGYSGVHHSTVELLCSLLNHKLSPLIFEHGGVGASGDLVQLAHLALCMIGEGEIFHKGKLEPTAKVFESLNIEPLNIKLREGLALINGTSSMTGIGLINIIEAKKLLYWAVILSALMNELFQSYDDHHAEVLNRAKKHNGQIEVASYLRAILSDSKCTRNRSESLKLNGRKESQLKEKLQECYSIRCVPQIIGPIKETIDNCERTLLNELNSANDNPIIDYKGNNVYHGGNFHGDYVSFEMDKLKIAITKLSMLCERQVNFLMNNKLNDKLSPFINMGRLGLNFGLQGIQFTATSTTAENQTMSFPMYVHSIPTNNDNQDIVSMGTNAALITKKVIQNGFEILGIGFYSAIQAVDYLDIRDKLSSVTKSCFEELRLKAEPIVEDKARYKEMKSIVDHLKNINSFDLDLI